MTDSTARPGLSPSIALLKQLRHDADEMLRYLAGDGYVDGLKEGHWVRAHEGDLTTEERTPIEAELEPFLQNIAAMTKALQHVRDAYGPGRWSLDG